MRQNILIILAIGLLALIFFPVSCGQKNPIKVEIKTEPIQFPMAVGMNWSYEIYDSLTALTDTMLVSIVDSTRDRCGHIIYTWNFYDGDSLVTYFWSLLNDSLIRYEEFLLQLPTELFMYPLELNESWTGPAPHSDSSHVSDSGLLETPAGLFDGAYRIDRTWNRDFEGGRDSTSTWIVPGVGLAQIAQYKSWSDGQNLTVSKNKVWSLIEYNLYTFSVADFPQTVGSWWVYDFSDSLNNIFDTIKVSIVDRIQVSEQDVAVWQYDFGDLVDTQYAFIQDSAIIFYSDTLAGFPNASYRFPMALGRFWGMIFFVPQTQLVEKGPIAVPAGQFKNGFRHSFYSYSFNYSHWTDDWLVPGVGMVKRVDYISDLGPGTVGNYILLDFYIAP